MLDFLYHDVRRVGSLLAQLSDAGLLTALRETEGKERGVSIAAEAKAEGKIPMLAKGGAGGSIEGRYSRTGQLERTFDPLWQNARKFVDFAREAARNLNEAQIGQIVSITGAVTIVDFDFLKNFIANKAIMESLLADNGEQDGNRQQRRANKQLQKKPAEPPIADLFGLFPYKIQMTLEGAETVWSTLAEEFLVTEASDLVLKYGRALDGEWTVVGVMDAAPHDFSGDILGDVDFDDGMEAFGMKITNAMAPMARVLLGRPSHAFGLTPLVIYRDIS